MPEVKDTSCCVLHLQEIEALRAKQRRLGIMAGLPPHTAAAPGVAAGATSLQQLPQHTPGLEQHPRLAAQQQQQGPQPVTGAGAGSSPERAAAAAGAGRARRQGGGIFALAHVPSTADTAAAAEEGVGSSFEGWGGAGEMGQAQAARPVHSLQTVDLWSSHCS